MMNNGDPFDPRLRKQEEMLVDERAKETKPAVKTLNRVPRACNACRKQKMRCEGADNPPCRRCRNTGLECLFEKPSKEASLTGEAGLERIRSLEAHVADLSRTQMAMRDTMYELVALLRGGGQIARSPYPQAPYPQPSPTLSTPTAGHPQPPGYMPPVPPTMGPPPAGIRPGQYPMVPQAPAEYSPQTPVGYAFSGPQPPPQGPAHGPPPAGVQDNRPLAPAVQAGTKRPVSADSSDQEDEAGDELPASGLVAPWEVLRGLADVAIERAAIENGDASDPQNGGKPGEGSRPAKKRKLRHKQGPMFPDVVTKKIITEEEARELFQIFYHGCSTFLPVFDPHVDTFDELHRRSPFAVDAICMVAAGVRDGGGKPSETYLRCLEEVQSISCATLFSPVTRFEAVQSMILVSGWAENGWLSGGHAVRMAMECSMHKAWPKLLKRITANKVDPVQDKDLVTATRTWFTLYLFEHQLSYGTGRPAVLKEDDSIRHGRALLQHPSAIEDDMRLVSTLELMVIRERVHNALSPSESPIREDDFETLRKADLDFRAWYATWDQAFSQKYEDAAFYRQSLQIQQLHAELFHNATALRGIDGPEDVRNMHPLQRELAVRSINIAIQILDITINSPSYREGMRYAVHYTHVTATFAGSFLLRLARLFPSECDPEAILHQVERLAELMAQIPAKRYALTLQLMLKRSRDKRKSLSPSSMREARPLIDPALMPPSSQPSEGSSPTFGNRPQQTDAQMQAAMQQGYYRYPMDAEHIWDRYQRTSSEQLPVWISDQTLGGQRFSQEGMNAYLLPNEYMPPAPQIW
ncbi:hypothetical protein K523DRAFT_411672 [Schizophyllum commune Tattone D]|nr:hypothetical protein K523DRAFT_411672 [Schizophyllum commune Tattone D]